MQAARDQIQTQMQATSAYHETQLNGANAKILHVSQMLDAMRAEQDRLRNDSQTAFNDLEARSGGRIAGTREVSFVSMKSFEGGKFAGGKSENFKAWAKRVRIFCNAQASGMKKAMEAAEASVHDLDLRSLGLADQKLAEELDTKLHDFLATYVSEEALRIVDGDPRQGIRSLAPAENPVSAGGRSDGPAPDRKAVLAQAL